MSEALSPSFGAAEPASVSDVEIESVATEIRQYAGAAMLEFACTVGRIVLDRFYDGDIEAFRAHGRKDASLRRLAASLDGALNLSASTLARCVATHAVLKDLGPISRWRTLTPTHVRAVLALPPAERARLLAEADAQGWSARQLEKQTRRERSPSPRGRRGAAAFLRAIQRYDADLAPDGRMFTLVRSVVGLDAARAEEAYATVQRIRENVERLHREMSLKRLGIMNAQPRAARPTKVASANLGRSSPRA